MFVLPRMSKYDLNFVFLNKNPTIADISTKTSDKLFDKLSSLP